MPYDIDHIYIVSSVHKYIYLLITVIQNYPKHQLIFSVYAFIFTGNCAPARKLKSRFAGKSGINRTYD